MRKDFRPLAIAALATLLIAPANLLAVVATVPASVQESPVIGTADTQYTVSNTSHPFTPFDITLFLSTTTGSNPTTTNTDWNSEVVDADNWTQPMQNVDGTTFPWTWQQYTSLTYTQAFPPSPASLNGYFLNYSLGPGGAAILVPAVQFGPGTTMGNFFFQGSPASTFLVAGPHDGSILFGAASVVTYSGTSTDLPEPTTAIIALAALATFSRRPRSIIR